MPEGGGSSSAASSRGAVSGAALESAVEGRTRQSVLRGAGAPSQGSESSEPGAEGERKVGRGNGARDVCAFPTARLGARQAEAGGSPIAAREEHSKGGRHTAEDAAFGVSLYVPLAHGVGAPEPAGQKAPAGHESCVPLVEPAGHKWPAAQAPSHVDAMRTVALRP